MKLNLDINSWCDIIAAQAEVSNHVFWVTSLDYKQQIFVSPSFEGIWGTKTDVLYKNPHYFYSRISSDNGDKFHQYCLERHQKEQSGHKTFQIRSEQGDERWIYDKFMTLYDTQGKPLAASGISIDITQKINFLSNDKVYRQVNHENQVLKNNYADILKEKLSVLTEDHSQSKPQLTKREAQCLQYLIKGLNARETGELLYISRRTVEKHIASAKEKLNCTKKTDLVRIIIEGNYLKNFHLR